MSRLIFQNTFVLMVYFLVKGGDASVRIGGVMVMTIVEMGRTSKIALVWKFFIFPFFVMFILCLKLERMHKIRNVYDLLFKIVVFRREMKNELQPKPKARYIKLVL